MLKDTIQAAVIQHWLDQQPKVPLTDKPLFRLVWSDDQKELRMRTCRQYSEGAFIREIQETGLTEKYSWLPERWVLEQWFPPEVSQTDELPESCLGSYEPIYVFDRKGEALPLALEPVQFVVRTALRPKRSGMFRKSLSEEVRAQKEKAARQADLDLLNDEGPLVSQFHDGSAILMPGKRESNESIS
jgi:hypothetical protein